MRSSGAEASRIRFEVQTLKNEHSRLRGMIREDLFAGYLEYMRQVAETLVAKAGSAIETATRELIGKYVGRLI